jgi:outer membrane protein insertion porin family
VWHDACSRKGMPACPDEATWRGAHRALTVVVIALAVCGTTTRSAAQDVRGRPSTAVPIRAIVVTGLQQIRESIVLDQLDVRAGDMFDETVVSRNIQRLDRLGVFSRIEIVPSQDADGVRLTIAVVETLRVLPAVSIAISDADGVSAGPTVRLLSFRGIPHEVSATARFGGSTLVEFKEVSPFLYKRRLWHQLRLTYEDRQNPLDDFAQTSVETDGQIGARLSARSKVGALFNMFTVASDVPGKTLSSPNRDWFFSGGALFEYDSRDFPTNPSRGWWNSVDFLWRGGSGTYVTLNFDGRRYQPLSEGQVLVASTLLTLQSGTIGEDVPVYGDYSLGGENTIRGWPFGSRRGKNQFINTLEYRYAIVRPRGFKVFGFNFYAGLAAAVFGDLGAVWTEPGEFTDRFIGGGGVGLRIVAPFVNLIRLDLSFGEPDGAAFFQLGMNEKFVTQRNRVR